jgi:peptide/nickel transport system permease protein
VLTYIFKRILLMIPTLLFVSVAIFAIINAAPGNPGQALNSSGSERADQSANAREGYRLFKEHYNLDKPVMLNFRFLITQQDVERHLQVIAQNMQTSIAGETEALIVGSTLSRLVGEIANAETNALRAELAKPGLSDDEKAALRKRVLDAGVVELDPFRPARPAAADVFKAEEDVENWGSDIVPHLHRIANDYLAVTPVGGGPLRSVAVADLDKPLADPFDPAGSVSVKGENLEVHRVMTQKVRFLAVQRLSVNARRRVLVTEGRDADSAMLERNREVVAENARVSQWTYPLHAPRSEREAVLANWNGWFSETAPRFERSLGSKVAMVFFETRFAKYWENLARLDLGTSTRFKRPVWDVIQEHWRYSIFLSIASLLLAYFISVPLGVLAAVRQNQFADRGVGVVLFVLYSLPTFFAATLMQTYLTPAHRSVFSWFPVSGFRAGDPTMQTTWEMTTDIVWHMVLPTICLTYGALAVLSRYARTGLLEVIRSDYIRTARAKGLPEWIVIIKHAVRNGMIPILTLLGTTLPALIGGSIIIEYIFAIDGMGKLMINAIQFRDYNVIMGELLIASVLTLIGILLSDISYALVDPRISFD